MTAERCQAMSKQGRPCKAPAVPGTTVCRYHGGAAPHVREAGQRRLAARRAAEAVATFGLPVDIAPDQALLEEVHRTAGHVAWLGQLVAQLEQHELKQLDMSERFEKASVWVELYQAERAHQVRVAKAALDAGVAERAVRLAEAQGRQLADVLRGVLADVFEALREAGLSVDVLVRVQREDVPAAIRRRLEEVVGGG